MTEPPGELAAGDPRAAMSPEQALLGGILERTLFDLRKLARNPRAAARAEVREIKEWIESDERGATMGGFTFLFVCEHLGLDPEYVRAQARRLEVPARRMQHRVMGGVRAVGGR